MSATASPDRDREKRQLYRLRGLRDGLEGLAWQIESSGNETFITAVRADGDVTKIATIHSDASPDEVDLFCGAVDSLRFTLTLIERAAARIRAMEDASGMSRPAAPSQPEKRKADNSAALSAKGLCSTSMFWRFLETKGAGGAVTSELAADTRLKFLLNITSKAELNALGPARDGFFKLRSEYYLWKKGDL